MENVQTHESTHSDRTSGAHQAHTPAQSEHYTAQMIADRYPELGIKENTIRTRWFEWLKKVAPELLLKTDKGFTQLAADLFDDFAKHVKLGNQKADDWVADAKARYSQEWSSAGVIEGELMPEEVGGTLALAQTTSMEMQLEGASAKLRLLQLIEQAQSAESSLSQSQREIARQRGENNAIEEFTIELEARLKTTAELRNKLGL
jgi:hypothetical protein